MTRWCTCLAAALLLAVLLPVAGVGTALQSPKTGQPPSVDQMLGAALHLEENEGEYDAALAVYQKVLSASGVSRVQAARALLHIGRCHEKLGQAEARAAYERLVKDYGDQAPFAGQAKARLAEIAVAAKSATGAGPGLTVRRVWAVPPTVDSIGTISADGRLVAVIDWAGAVALVDPVSQVSRRVVEVGREREWDEFALRPVLARDGQRVAYMWFINDEDVMELRVVDVPSRRWRTVWSSRNAGAAKLSCEPLDWSPSGLELLVNIESLSSGAGARLARLTLETGEVRPLVDFQPVTAGRSVRARFSPDGRFVAFSQPTAGADADIAIIRIGTSDAAVVRHPANDQVADWTADGRALLFVSDRSGDPGVWSQPVNDGQPTGEAELIKDRLGSLNPLGLTSSGTMFYSARRRTRDVMIAEMDFAAGRLRSAPTRLLQHYVGNNGMAAWLPGATSLVVAADFAGDGWDARAVVVAEPDGAGERVVRLQAPIALTGLWAFDRDSVLTVTSRAGTDRRLGLRDVLRIALATGAVTSAGGGASINPLRMGPGRVEGLASSPDPQTRRSTVKAVDLSTGSERTLFQADEPSGFWPLIVSPDGKRAAGSFNRFENQERPRMLRVISLDGDGSADLYPLPAGLTQGSWVPDGSGIVAAVREVDAGEALRTGDDRYGVWFYPVPAGEPRKLFVNNGYILSLAVSPDGRRIAYTAQRQSFEIWALENFLPPATPK